MDIKMEMDKMAKNEYAPLAVFAVVDTICITAILIYHYNLFNVRR